MRLLSLRTAPLFLIPSLLTATSISAQADAIAPHRKYIMHVIKLEGQREYAGKYRFYLVTGSWPLRNLNRIGRAPGPKTESIPDAPTTPDEKPAKETLTAMPMPGDGAFNTKNVSPSYSLRLGAIPAKTVIKGDPARLFEDNAPGVLLSEPIERQRTASDTEPKDTLTTRYRVLIKDIPGVKGASATKKLSLAKISETMTAVPASGRGVLLGIPAMALLGLMGRMRPRRENESEE